MWRSTMILLALIAALAGGPLRQAEAASDLARSLGEVGADGLEAIDGGVGDDSGASLRVAAVDAEATLGVIPAALAWVVAVAPRLPGPDDPRRVERRSPTPMGWPLRQAWLARFLF